jgi:hypothetical protein
MSEAVLVYLWGGLGNQLFQYCAGLAIAAVSPFKPAVFLMPAQENGHSKRDYRRELMPAGLPVDSNAQLTADVTFWPKDGFAPWDPAGLVKSMRSAGSRRLFLRGYFQYLPAIIQQVALVRDELVQGALADLRDRMALKYRIQNPRAAASLHVRRGDYVKLQAEGFHLLGPEYYRPAIQAVQGSLGITPRWLVASNDPAWCRTQPWLPPGAEVVDESDELATLALLSLCQAAAVTSNSTFSWWGAVLANPTIATYSTRWIGDKKPNLFPATWMRIDA